MPYMYHSFGELEKACYQKAMHQLFGFPRSSRDNAFTMKSNVHHMEIVMILDVHIIRDCNDHRCTYYIVLIQQFDI